MQEKPAPYFSLNSFSGAAITSDQFKGKLVLLDFWEVWCGPCVESMPKVQEIYKKYKDNGLLVYGVTHEKEVLDVAKRLIKEKGISFPMLIGNVKSKREYSIQAVPVYILIGKDGKVLMVSEGYPADLEEAIQKHL
jgi:thiol-disulfide isomerase/thioredoxin